ncbi:frustulin 5 [Phaeodactylum tricornutum CCAP 1055/1]|uniref:Frustulin 5 n=1 Tax=Phaeodactylum tricornutum (strain CCAP 1055/1) TaxID=556484 RepID=B7S3M3_PHATC|nr:frustulin 5 [Phaeodactylum tricornutum CCAP 1055/1]EEC42847.1 frustulin 5 [Phaeodactylum tricornutum CCAP 1055/1]|eukprot:XP_002176167.1 frustulin 5 [Phaeodactylum tricornutum CCAP 1055/1]
MKIKLLSLAFTIASAPYSVAHQGDDVTRQGTDSTTEQLRVHLRRLKLPALVVVGDNGTPSSAFPLKICQGDCDKDSDCEGSLKCFMRNGGEAVPGCSGGEDVASRADFCYDPMPTSSPIAMPSAVGPDVVVVGDNGTPLSAFPLKVCQGDCDKDSDCEGSLKCFMRDGGEAVPGCNGGEDVASRADFCYDPMATSSPVSMATSSPVAMATSSPVAMATSSPVVMATSSPVAMATSSPVAMATSSPVAMATSSPVAMATPSPVVMATSSPVAMATSSPVIP